MANKKVKTDLDKAKQIIRLNNWCHYLCLYYYGIGNIEQHERYFHIGFNLRRIYSDYEQFQILVKRFIFDIGADEYKKFIDECAKTVPLPNSKQ